MEFQSFSCDLQEWQCYSNQFWSAIVRHLWPRPWPERQHCTDRCTSQNSNDNWTAVWSLETWSPVQAPPLWSWWRTVGRIDFVFLWACGGFWVLILVVRCCHMVALREKESRINVFSKHLRTKTEYIDYCKKKKQENAYYIEGQLKVVVLFCVVFPIETFPPWLSYHYYQNLQRTGCHWFCFSFFLNK